MLTYSFMGQAKVCNKLRAAILATANAGATKIVISKGASDLYPVVSTSGQGSHCKYLRYAFRTLKKPYEGDSVSPREWDQAIQAIIKRTEY